MEIETENLLNRLTCFLEHSAKRLRKQGAVVGLSGGIDSAVVLFLAKYVFGDNVFALILPEEESDPYKIDLAISLAQQFELQYEVYDISHILESFGCYEMLPLLAKNASYLRNEIQSFRDVTKTTFLQGISISQRPSFLKHLGRYFMPKIRIRMILLTLKAYELDYALLGTTDRTEYEIGQYDPFGDGVCDIEALTTVYKTDIIKLAKHIGIPEEIIKQKPSHDLLPGITNLDTIGFSYELLDAILKGSGVSSLVDIAHGMFFEDDIEKLVVEVKQAKLHADARRKLPILLKAPLNEL